MCAESMKAKFQDFHLNLPSQLSMGNVKYSVHNIALQTIYIGYTLAFELADLLKVLVGSALASGACTVGEVGFVALHGTGTPLGDPIEIGALAQSLSTAQPRECPATTLSSVKARENFCSKTAYCAVLSMRPCILPGIIPTAKSTNGLRRNLSNAQKECTQQRQL